MPLLTLNPTDPRALTLMDAQRRELIALYDDEASTEPFSGAARWRAAGL